MDWDEIGLECDGGVVLGAVGVVLLCVEGNEWRRGEDGGAGGGLTTRACYGRGCELEGGLGWLGTCIRVLDVYTAY